MDDISETIKSALEDELIPVSAAFISRVCEVDSQTAKQSLQKFVDDKTIQNLHITYILTGFCKQKLLIKLVPDSQLDQTKLKFENIISCCPYAIHKQKIDHSSLLLDADQSLATRNPVIVCNKDKTTSYEERISRTLVSSQDSTKSSQSSNKISSFGKTSTSTSSAHKKKESSEGSSTSTHKEEKAPKRKTAQRKKGPAKQQQISFSQGPSGHSKKPPKKAEKSPVIQERSDPKATEPHEAKVDSGNGIASSTTDDADVTKTRKHNVITSDDEEDESQNSINGHSEPIPVSSQETKSETDTSSVVSSQISNDSKPKKRRRVKKRVKVPNAYLDDDGFMVTQTTWKEVETSESEPDSPKKTRRVEEKENASSTSKEENKSKASDESSETKPKARGKKKKAGGAGQASIMTFFKKT